MWLQIIAYKVIFAIIESAHNFSVRFLLRSKIKRPSEYYFPIPPYILWIFHTILTPVSLDVYVDYVGFNVLKIQCENLIFLYNLLLWINWDVHWKLFYVVEKNTLKFYYEKLYIFSYKIDHIFLTTLIFSLLCIQNIF